MPTLFQAARNTIERVELLRELKYAMIRPLHRLTAPRDTAKKAQSEIARVRACPEYALIPQVPDAGKIKRGRLIMHCGVGVVPGSYYGYYNLVTLMGTGGVHEPQEEYIFHKVLQQMPPSATMLELGAYWGFYSLWFHQAVGQPRCYLVEPNLSNLHWGQKNFKVNRFTGQFTQAYVGSKSSIAPDGVPQICVDDFLAKKQIEHLHILHSDIQGAEHDMLVGSENSICARKIDYLFISTHSDTVHNDCLTYLQKHDYLIIASITIDDAFAADGVIVARRQELVGLEPFEVSRRSQHESTSMKTSSTP